MADRVDILSRHVPIVDDEGRPTAEFMLQWSKQQRVLLTIPDVTTAAKLSALIDLIGSTEGDILRRGVTEWDTLAYSGNVNTFLNGNGAYTQIAEAGFTFTDNTTANATTGRHGLLPKLSGTATEFLAGDGTWATPSGGGGGSGPTVPTVRDSASQSFSSGSSFTVNFPSGALEDDTLLIFIGSQYGVSSAPTGWFAAALSSAGFYNGTLIIKTLTASDISTGSVTVSLSGSEPGLAFSVAFEGSVSCYGGALVEAPGSTTASSNEIPAPPGTLPGTLTLLFSGVRGSATVAFDIGTELEAIDSGTNSGVLYTFEPTTSFFTATASYGSSFRHSEIAISVFA